MNSKIYQDHILGEQHGTTSAEELHMLRRIIKVDSEKYTEEERMNFHRIGLHLRMRRYLEQPIKKIILTGEFLGELLNIYKVKKIKFAELINYESSNLHAILKGRRRMSNKIAIKVGAIFSIDPQLWMFIEAKNELAKFRANNDIPTSLYTIDKLRETR